MAYEYVLYEKRDRIAYVTINRPESMNALHPDASREMRGAFEDFRDDPDVWIAIVTGAGERAFCAGFDLKYAASRKDRNPATSVPLACLPRHCAGGKPAVPAVHVLILWRVLGVAGAVSLTVTSSSSLVHHSQALSG